jgi:hypothetical protein
LIAECLRRLQIFEQLDEHLFALGVYVTIFFVKTFAEPVE